MRAYSAHQRSIRLPRCSLPPFASNMDFCGLWIPFQLFFVLYDWYHGSRLFFRRSHVCGGSRARDCVVDFESWVIVLIVFVFVVLLYTWSKPHNLCRPDRRLWHQSTKSPIQPILKHFKLLFKGPLAYIIHIEVHHWIYFEIYSTFMSRRV